MAGTNEDFGLKLSGEFKPNMKKNRFTKNAANMLISTTFLYVYGFLTTRAKMVMGAKMVIVEIPTTIKSTILGKINAIARAVIPKMKVATLIIKWAFFLDIFCVLLHPAKSFTADIEIIFRKLSPDDINADSNPTIANASRTPVLCLSMNKYATPAVSFGCSS